MGKSNSSGVLYFLIAALLIGEACSSSAFAQQMHELDPIVMLKEGEALAAGDEVAQSLISFEKHVEEEAYDDTMKLCEGYRAAWGLAPSHGSYGSVYSQSESLAVWAKVFAYGLGTPFSAIRGVKKDYINTYKLKMWSWQSWLGSLYAIYLIRSWGFLRAAVHCLGTMDQREIHLFASAIVAADYESTLGGMVGLAALPWTVSRVLSALQGASRFVLFPAQNLLNLAKRRVSKTQLILGGAIVLPVAADEFHRRMELAEKTKELHLDLMAVHPPGYESELRKARLLLMSTALEKFWTEWNLDPEVPNFRAWAKSNVSKQIFNKAKGDLDFLERYAQSMPDRDKLKMILPVLEQVELDENPK